MGLQLAVRRSQLSILNTDIMAEAKRPKRETEKAKMRKREIELGMTCILRQCLQEILILE